MSGWWEQAAKAVSERFTPAVAFRAYRDICEGTGFDPYREPMFERVWVRAERDGTTFGLQFGGMTMEGWLHADAAALPSEWVVARGLALEQISDRLFERVERQKNPYHDFVAFAEQAGVEGGGQLADWQREFAEQVERGNVDVAAIAGRKGRKEWTAKMMRRYEELKQAADAAGQAGRGLADALAAGRDAAKLQCSYCGHGREHHELHPTGSGRLRGACTFSSCDCAAYVL